jgi:hypothetical protein
LADTVETGAVVLVRDPPAEDLPWLALHPAGEWSAISDGSANRRCGGATGR